MPEKISPPATNAQAPITRTPAPWRSYARNAHTHCMVTTTATTFLKTGTAYIATGMAARAHIQEASAVIKRQ